MLASSYALNPALTLRHERSQDFPPSHQRTKSFCSVVPCAGEPFIYSRVHLGVCLPTGTGCSRRAFPALQSLESPPRCSLPDSLCICSSAPFRLGPCPLISVESVLSISGFRVGAAEDVGHRCMHVAGRGRPLSVSDCLWNRVSHYTRSSPIKCTILDDIKADYLLGYKV